MHRIRGSRGRRGARSGLGAGSRGLATLLPVIFLAAVDGGAVAAQDTRSVEYIEEQRALALVRSLATGDLEEALRVFEANFAADTWARRTPEEWRGVAQRLMGLGKLEVQGVEITRPHAVDLLVRSAERGAAARFAFEFESQEPYRIRGIGVEMGGPGGPRANPYPALELEPGADRDAIAAALERYFAELGRADRFSGAVLVAHRGEVLFTAAHGEASKRYGAPNRADTRFDLGSINKSFTKIAVAQLLSQGLLSLDDRIVDHLPDYPNPEVAEQVTVGQLLEHSSGLGDIFTDEFFRSSRALYRSPRDYFPVFAERPLRFEPGTAVEYSNAGYIVLGAIVEAASGEAFDEYVGRRVFEPAGMASSGFFARDGLEPNVAEGYTRRGPGGGEGELRSNVYRLPAKGNPAGSAQSTVEDLLRFDTALREHALLPPAYTAWVFGGPVPQPGQAVDPAPSRAGWGIAGGGPGVSAVLESDGELVIVILANYDEPMAEAIARRLGEALRPALR